MAFWKKRGKADEDASTEVQDAPVPAEKDAEETDADSKASDAKADDEATAAAETDEKSDDAEETADEDSSDNDPAADKTDSEKADDAAEEEDSDDDDKPAAAKKDDDSEESDDETDEDSDKDSEEDSDDSDSDSDEDDDEDEERPERSEETDELWTTAEIDPVQIVLPAGTGFTLRHYRIVTDDEGDDAEEAVFLAHKGKLHLFKSAEGLVEYVKGDAEHDLKKLDTWDALVEAIKVEDVLPDEEDEYELDLVVQNLRGGHDVWDPDLLIGAGEVTRDIAFACQLDDVLSALAPDTPSTNSTTRCAPAASSPAARSARSARNAPRSPGAA